MAILNFVKPDKIVLQKATEFEAQFEFRPLEPGYGVTIEIGRAHVWTPVTL